MLGSKGSVNKKNKILLDFFKKYSHLYNND